jgi:hypothetical protein
VRKLACAFFECLIYSFKPNPVGHQGGSQLPHSKAPSARHFMIRS